jgi:hypothetical protein
MTYIVGSSGSSLEQAQPSGSFKPINGVPTFPLLIIGSRTATQIQ